MGRHAVVFADWVKIAFTDAQTIDDFIVYSVQYNYTHTNRPDPRDLAKCSVSFAAFTSTAFR